MSREEDLKLIASESGITVIDLTPTPLTAPGVGPWCRCYGKPGWVQAAQANVAGTADMLIEASIDRVDGTEDTIVAFDQTSQADRGRGGTLFAGPIWIRFRLVAITGVGNSVTCCGAWS